MSTTRHAAYRDDRGVRGVLPETTLFDHVVEAELLAPRTIEARFVAFHAEHPEVLAKLRELALGLVRRGHRHLGIGVLWETLRYQTLLGYRPDEAEPYRLNDHYRSRYARLLMETTPELEGVFETRELKTA